MSGFKTLLILHTPPLLFPKILTSQPPFPHLYPQLNKAYASFTSFFAKSIYFSIGIGHFLPLMFQHFQRYIMIRFQQAKNFSANLYIQMRDLVAMVLLSKISNSIY
jgi:hypothetical protein